MKPSVKPIGKCKGCPLNLRTECAVHVGPAEMWSKGRCKDYGKEELLREYLKRIEQLQTNPRLKAREQRRKLSKQVVHKDHRLGRRKQGEPRVVPV